MRILLTGGCGYIGAHAVDLAEAHVRALDYLAEGGRSLTLNLGTGRGASVRDVLHAAQRAAGRAVPTVEMSGRPGDPPAIWLDVDRARHVLGWKPAMDLDAMVASAWRWHSSHPGGTGEAAPGDHPGTLGSVSRSQPPARGGEDSVGHAAREPDR